MRNDSISETLNKHWSSLPIFDRAVLLWRLGIDGKNEEYLGGKTMDTIIHSNQDGLPGEVRGRLLLAVTKDGFSLSEYERIRGLLRGETTTEPPIRERGN